MSKPQAFASIAPKLGKMLPMLSSDKSGDVVVAAAAIGRILGSVGLDWHDLSKRVAEPSIADLIAEAFKPKQPTPPPAPEPTWQSPSPPPKAKREPSPWPTWGTLSHFGKLGMFDVIKAEGRLTPEDATAFAAFYASYYRHQCGASRRNTNLFNAACRDLWERGWRPEEKAA